VVIQFLKVSICWKMGTTLRTMRKAALIGQEFYFTIICPHRCCASSCEVFSVAQMIFTRLQQKFLHVVYLLQPRYICSSRCCQSLPLSSAIMEMLSFLMIRFTKLCHSVAEIIFCHLWCAPLFPHYYHRTMCCVFAAVIVMEAAMLFVFE